MKTILTAALTTAALSCPVLGQSWTYIEQLIPEDASADASVIVGSTFGGSARWTAAGGMQVFGTESRFGPRNRAEAVTADGTQIFGHDSNRNGRNIDRMYRWTGPGSFQSLGIFGAAERIKVNAASADGTTVVATASAGQGSLYQGCVWTAQSGFRSIPGVGSYSTAVAVTADGSKIAGSRATPNNREEAYVWSADTGITVLTTANTHTTQAHDRSANGRFVAGSSFNARGHATLWTDTVSRSLGVLDNFVGSVALSVSDDGSIVTGYCSGLSGPVDPDRDEFVWTAEWGMLDLHVFLNRHGIEVPAGMYINTVKVSADGRTLYGLSAFSAGSSGTFVATIPSPGSLMALVGLSWIPRRRR